MSCMILTEDVCRASLAQLTSLAIDILFPPPRLTPLHVPVPPTPPKFTTPAGLEGLTPSKLGVRALLPSEMGGEGGVCCRRTGEGDPSFVSCDAVFSFNKVNSSLRSRSSSFRR